MTAFTAAVDEWFAKGGEHNFAPLCKTHSRWSESSRTSLRKFGGRGQGCSRKAIYTEIDGLHVDVKQSADAAEASSLEGGRIGALGGLQGTVTELDAELNGCKSRLTLVTGLIAMRLSQMKWRSRIRSGMVPPPWMGLVATGALLMALALIDYRLVLRMNSPPEKDPDPNSYYPSGLASDIHAIK